MDLILKISTDVEDIVAMFTKNLDDRNDLRQDVLLKCMDNYEKVRDIYANGNIRGWLYFVTRNMVTNDQKHEAVKRNTNANDLIYDDVDLDQKINRVKTFPDMLAKLTSDERMWIIQYMECDQNILEMHRRTKISQPKIKERINFIFSKWKQLDIYLPR